MPVDADKLIEKAIDKGIDIGAKAVEGLINKGLSGSKKEDKPAPVPAAASAPPTPGPPPPPGPEKHAPHWQLRITQGPVTAHEFHIDRLPIVIGREAGADWVVPDSSVSRRHAELFSYNNQFWIKDLGSRNHTIVNGQMVTDSELHSGDVITLGSTVITIEYA